MKQDQQKQMQSVRGEQQSEEKLSTIVGQTFTNCSPKINKLIFISRSIAITYPIASSLLKSVKLGQLSNSLTLLIDFENNQVDQINGCILDQMLNSPKKKYFSDGMGKQLKVTRLSNQTIQKRKGFYILGGVYHLTCQIFLTDLLRGQTTIDPKTITKIIIKVTEKVTDYYHYYAWLATYIKVQEQANRGWACPIFFLSLFPHHYADQLSLQKIYRTFYCKKVVIWPFGRAEIHKRLSAYRGRSEVKEWDHKLWHSEGQKKIEQILMKIYNFLKKGYCNKYGDKAIPVHESLYQMLPQLNQKQHHRQYAEFQNIKHLLSLLVNTNKITMLNTVGKFIAEESSDLWNSNNSAVIQMIQELQGTLKDHILLYQKKQDINHTVDLLKLLTSIENPTYHLNSNQTTNFTCKYQLQLSLKVNIEHNHKIDQLLKVVQSSKNKCNSIEKQHISEIQQQSEIQQFSEIQQKLSEQQLSLIELQTKLNYQKHLQHHNVLVICAQRTVNRYVCSCLSGYLTNQGYRQYLMAVHSFLRAQRPLRLTQIKKIYDRRKLKKIQGQEDPKVCGCKKSWVEQNKLIAEEVLCNQLQVLHQIILNYDLQLSILNQQMQDQKRDQKIFNINQEEQKIKKQFNDSLIQAQFQIIDTTLLQIAGPYLKLQNYMFHTADGLANVVVDYHHHLSEPTNLYQTLKILNPQTIVFYGPNSVLLRSVYLYKLQNQSVLKDIHIFSFVDSYQAKVAIHQVTKEDKAFWQISQNRAQLHQFIQSPFLRIKNINMNDIYSSAKQSIRAKSLLQDEPDNSLNLKSIDFSGYRRVVLVDTRQFKSSLPSYLYHCGFQVIPMFLKTADYILSDDVAIQKKSVHTRDLHNSLKSPRLQDQLKRLSASFKFAYLLIECEEQSDCVKANFGLLDGTNGSKSRFELRRRLMQLMHKYFNVKVIWSTSVGQSCQFIKQLKKDRAEPDLLKFSKNEEDNQVSINSKELPKIKEESQKLEND